MRRGLRFILAPDDRPRARTYLRCMTSPTANPTDLAIETRGLGKRFGDRAALVDIGLEVPRGVAYGFLGANGAGKTTLIRLLLGLAEPTAGSMRVLGHDVRTDRAAALARVGAIIEEPRFHRHLSGRENLHVNAAARDRSAHGRVDAALERVGLQDEADRAPHQLSAWQRRRAAVAGVLAMEPDVLILDEPSSAMDPAARRELADVLVSLRITTLVVTHDLPYALELCPRAVVLDRGVVVADGATREVLSDEGFMRAHRLELPAGFNPLSA